MAPCSFIAPIGKIILGMTECADAADLNIFVQNAAATELLFTNGPKVKIVGLRLKAPKIFREFLLIVFILCMVWAQRGGNTDEEIVGLGPQIALHGGDETSINILYAASPTRMGDGHRFMHGIIKNSRLAIRMGDGKSDIALCSKERIGGGDFLCILDADPLDIRAMR